MAIMLAGVEYPEIDPTIKVPEKLETKVIGNEAIQVPKISGTEINNNSINVKPEQRYFEDSIKELIFSKLETSEINNKLYTATINSSIVNSKVSIPNPDNPLRFSNTMYSNLSLMTATNINLPSPEDFIPVYSEDYLTSLNKAREVELKKGFETYNQDFIKEIGKLEGRLSKYAYSVVNKIFNTARTLNSESGNQNLYGEIPQGYVLSIDRGKVRWETIEFATIAPDRPQMDRFLASQGFIKLGDRSLRPDLNLDITNKKDVVNMKDATNSINVEYYYNRHFEEKIFPNRSVYYMLSSGADFLQNMWDMALVVDDNENYFTSIFEKFYKTNIVNSSFGDYSFFELNNLNFSSLMVRTSGVEIPQIENEIFQVRFLSRSINKVRSKIKYERKANLKILLDEPLYIRMLFNLLSGTFNGYSENTSAFEKRPKSLYPSVFSLKEKENNFKLHILIKHEALLNYPYLEKMKQTWRIAHYDKPEKVGYAELNPAEYPIWWFENVKFLGEGSDLVFDRDGNSTTELSFPFIFARCVKLDRSVKTSEPTFFTETGPRNIPQETLGASNLTNNQNHQRWMQDTSFWKEVVM